MFDWHKWIEQHESTLRAIGLPVDVYMSHEHWLDFLENGHLHWHPNEDAGFDIVDLNDAQQGHLLRFLEAEIDNDPFRMSLQTRMLHGPTEICPLLEYLRRGVGSQR